MHWPFFEGVGRAHVRYVCTRVYVACAYNLLRGGGSCTGDQGSSELVSPLKAFLLSSTQEHYPPLPLPEFSRRAKEARWQKCESLILLNNRSTMQRIRFYGIAVGASSNPNLVHIILFRHVQCMV